MESEKKREMIPIPEDILILILNRLLLKTQCRLKAVSKSWSSLISAENLRRPHFLGLFYNIFSSSSYCGSGDNNRADLIFRYIDANGIHNSSIDVTLPLTPGLRRLHDLDVLDCCNGLLLCYSCDPMPFFYISLLDFNPEVSPYFRVFSFSASQDGQMQIRVLSSDSPSLTWREYKPVNIRRPNDDVYGLMDIYQHHALWKGSLYSLLSSHQRNFGDDGKIMRIGPLDEEGNGVEAHFIELPVDTKKPTRVSIGRQRDKLCLAGADWNKISRQARLRVWSLLTRDQTVWEMEHDAIIYSDFLTLDEYNKEPPYV